MRKHLGLMPPAPVQAAMIAALGDDEHVSVQRERYRARRDTHAAPPSRAAGFRIDESGAGLYLWATRGEDCWATRRRRWPTTASWSRRASSTGRRARSTCGSR